MIVLDVKDLEKYPSFKNSIVQDGNTLYKIDRNLLNRDEFLFYLLNMPKIDGLVQPTDLIWSSNGVIHGFAMDYIAGAIDLQDYIKQQNKEFDIDIINTIYNLFTILEETHKYLILGDVRNKNILLTSDKVYICDLDGSTYASTPKHLIAYYIIDGANLIDTALTDTCKCFISAMSLYYNCNFEDLCGFYKISLYRLLELLCFIKANPLFIDYTKSLINDLEKHNNNVSIDFKDIITLVNPPSKEELTRVRYNCFSYKKKS